MAMSEVVLTSDELDDYVRHRVESILITSCNNSSRMLHMMSEEDWMEPACNTTTRRGGWIDKPIAVYPPDYHPVCPDCVETHFGVEVTDE